LTFYGYRSHLNRTHKELLQIAREVKQPQDLAQDIEIEEPAGDVFTRQPLSDEDEDNPPWCTAQEHWCSISLVN